MKIGRVEIGARVTVGARSTILYDAKVGEGASLGPLTLVAKGEELPAGTWWEGSPAARKDWDSGSRRDFEPGSPTAQARLSVLDPKSHDTLKA